MVNIPDANDPFRTDPLNAAPRDPIRLDNELQPDPELAEGRAGGSRIAVYAVAAAILLGAVFYGLNSGTTPNDAGRTASTAPTTQDNAPKAPFPTNNIADSNSRPPVAPGVRDVTPRNSDDGMTTGSAPANSQAPQSAPTGTEVDRSKGTTQ
jgi:hypothetical protein